MCASVLPTRSAPMSAALVYMPPPTRLNKAISEQPSAYPRTVIVNGIKFIPIQLVVTVSASG